MRAIASVLVMLFVSGSSLAGQVTRGLPKGDVEKTRQSARAFLTPTRMGDSVITLSYRSERTRPRGHQFARHTLTIDKGTRRASSERALKIIDALLKARGTTDLSLEITRKTPSGQSSTKSLMVTDIAGRDEVTNWRLNKGVEGFFARGEGGPHQSRSMGTRSGSTATRTDRHFSAKTNQLEVVQSRESISKDGETQLISEKEWKNGVRVR